MEPEESSSSSDSENQAKDTQSNFVPKVRKQYTIQRKREKWTKEEHERFIQAIEQHGRNWKIVEDFVQTKSRKQIRSHAQKHFEKLKKSGSSFPPPRAKKKASHPYPSRKTQEMFALALAQQKETDNDSPTNTANSSTDTKPSAFEQHHHHHHQQQQQQQYHQTTIASVAHTSSPFAPILPPTYTFPALQPTPPKANVEQFYNTKYNVQTDTSPIIPNSITTKTLQYQTLEDGDDRKNVNYYKIFSLLNCLMMPAKFSTTTNLRSEGVTDSISEYCASLTTVDKKHVKLLYENLSISLANDHHCQSTTEPITNHQTTKVTRKQEKSLANQVDQRIKTESPSYFYPAYHHPDANRYYDNEDRHQTDFSHQRHSFVTPSSQIVGLPGIRSDGVTDGLIFNTPYDPAHMGQLMMSAVNNATDSRLNARSNTTREVGFLTSNTSIPGISGLSKSFPGIPTYSYEISTDQQPGISSISQLTDLSISNLSQSGAGLPQNPFQSDLHVNQLFNTNSNLGLNDSFSKSGSEFSQDQRFLNSVEVDLRSNNSTQSGFLTSFGQVIKDERSMEFEL